MAFSLAQNGLVAQQRPAQRASRRAASLRVSAQSGKDAPSEIYIGKGKTVQDDPAKYPDRNGLGVGGWAGGEVQLKEWAAVPFSPLDPKLRKALDAYAQKEDTKEDKKEGNIYIGKGRFIKDDIARYPDRDWIGVGGWAGGEVGLKEAAVLSLPAGTRVRIKGEPAEWKRNGLFANVPSLFFSGETGEVRAVRIKGGKAQVALTLDGDKIPAGGAAEEDVEWKKTVVINASDIEVL